MQNKKIVVVTGGAGFIGSHLVEHLVNKNYEVRVIDDLSGGRLSNLDSVKNKKNLKFEKKDILSLQANEKIFKEANYVFHLAGRGDIVPSIEKPLEYFEINNLGTIKVLENCRDKKKFKKFVYAASSSCYGLTRGQTCENAKIDNKYPYALSKYFGEQSALHWGKVYKIPVNSIRIFNAYGPRVKTTGVYGAVFGVFFKQKLEGKKLTIVGDGKQKRDFLYVTDIAEAFENVALSKFIGEVYNLGAGNPVSVNYLAKLIGGKTTHIPKRPGEPEITWANIKKIKKHTKWKPNISFQEGVKFMLNSIHEWQEAPLWSKKKISKATVNWFKYLKN
jgi:UDP-glucose 4-epimerase